MQYTVVAFHIIAHEDDWELFPGEQAYADIQANPSYEIVFIHTTAGDAGLTDGWWEAREQGAIAAVRAAAPAQSLTIHVDHVNGHPVQHYTCANTAIYFMRLPDGNPDGTGYPSTNHQYLSQLRDADSPIVAVDGSTTYTTWSDFCDTLSAFVQAERQGIPQEHPWINASDYCASTNPGDHADHRATGDAVRSFAGAQGCNRAWFLTYCIASCPVNLGGPVLLNKKRTFDAYGLEVLRVTTLDGIPVQPVEAEWTYWGEHSYVRLLNWDQRDTDDPLPPTGCPGTGRLTFMRAAQHLHGQPPRRVVAPRR
jgi:GlcNAc-PI de-N-acetylase